MTAARILDRLTRVRQSRPGSWSSACPLCESRKGRPLAVTEKDDGRVLLHAFCGCTTEDVLGRLGLSVTDLFATPITQYAAPAPARIPARDVLDALSTEITFVAVLAADILASRTITGADWQRLAAAAQRIGSARDLIR